MNSKSLIIAITPETEVPNEAKIITGILDSGVDFVHLRHPGAITSDIKRIIEDIPHRLRRRLRLHGHFELVWEFNLGGLHLNSRCSSAPAGYKGSLSRSCHSIAEVKSATAEGVYDYVTLSPIFGSISKIGYGGDAFLPEELSQLTAEDRVVALGGITPERIATLKRYQFVGYAFLGYIWNSEDPITMAKKI